MAEPAIAGVRKLWSVCHEGRPVVLNPEEFKGEFRAAGGFLFFRDPTCQVVFTAFWIVMCVL